MHKAIFAIVTAAAILISTGEASAQIGDVDASDKEIVASGIWILGYQDQGDVSSTSFTVIGEGAFRYFIVDKLGIGLSAAAFFKSAGDDADDSGFTIQAISSYYQPLSDSLYIAPGLGLGVSFGTRERPGAMPGVINESDVLGFTASFGLPFVLFTPGPFNIRAGPELIATFGSAEDIATGDSEGFTTVDGGFKIGAGFNF